ncbi:glycosyltransferase family 4 protein [Leucobacter sp. W1153]
MLQSAHDVTVLHFAKSGDLDSEEPRCSRTDSGILVKRIEFNPFRAASVRRARRALVRELNNSDVLHSMAMHSLLPLLLVRPNVPWIHTEHWSGLMQTKPALKKRIGRSLLVRFLLRPDVLVAVGHDLAAAMKDHARVQIRVIPNHVSLGSSDGLAEPPEARNGSPLRMIGVGNLIAHKGPLLALDAVKELRVRGIAAELTWVGKGPLESAMVERSKELELANCLHLPGQVEPNLVSNLLRRSHLFILPTHSETFGVAFAEALGQGLPVVATGYGEHLDFLPPEASRIAPQRTGSVLAEAVISLISDSRRWSPAEISSYAQSRFAEQGRRDQYASAYSEALCKECE